MHGSTKLVSKHKVAWDVFSRYGTTCVALVGGYVAHGSNGRKFARESCLGRKIHHDGCGMSKKGSKTMQIRVA